MMSVSILAVAVVGLVIIMAVALVAIAAKRPGLAAAIGGMILLAIGFCAVLVPVVAYSDRVSVITPESHANSVDVGPIHVEKFGPNPLAIRPDWIVLLNALSITIFVALLVALVVWLTRRPAADGNRRTGWLPALLLIPLIAVLLWGGTRVRTSSRHAPQVEALHQDIARQRAEMSSRGARMNAEVQHQIASMNIHDLMDKADAPRIALAPEPPPAPPSPTDGTTPNESESAAAAKDEEKATDDKKEPASDAESQEAKEVASEANASEKASETPPIDKDSTADDDGSSRDASTAGEVTASASPDGRDEEPSSSNDEVQDDNNLASQNEESDSSRPTWVVTPPKRIGNVQQEVIVTDEWATREECDRARDIGLMLKTYERIQRLIGAPYHPFDLDHRMNSENSWSDHPLTEMARMGITLDFVHREIAKDEYLETADRSFGKMLKLYTLVEFSPAVDRELRSRWEARERQERVWMVGVGASGILGLIGIAFGLLKIDTWTKGYYTKRLFIGVPTAIITLIALLALEISR